MSESDREALLLSADRTKTIIQAVQKVNFSDIGNSFLPRFKKITSV
jgi:hypothetical protein